MVHLHIVGTKERKVPYPTGNPFTVLFNLVSCPNYTYEVGRGVDVCVYGGGWGGGVGRVCGRG